MSFYSIVDFIKEYYPQYFGIESYPVSKSVIIHKVKEEWGIFCNFAPTPIVIDGVTFKNSEQLFQLMKFQDPQPILEIYSVGNPKMTTKKWEKTHRRADWGTMVIDAMKFCLVKKYEQSQAFRDKLNASAGKYIVEDQSTFTKKNPDAWGVKRHDDLFVGPNLLGRLLMELRNTGKLDYTLPDNALDFITVLKTHIQKHMNNLLLTLNNEAKTYEIHHDINLLVDGIEIKTTFDSFTNATLDIIEFNLIDESSQMYAFEYSFLNGSLSCKSHTNYIEIDGVLSYRHLNSFLFFAREFIFMKNNSHNELTTYLHSSQPVPILYAERSSLNIKHIFKVDNIIKCTDRTIVVDGILSMKSNTDFWLPVYARCKYNYKGSHCEWTFDDMGKKTIVKTDQSYSVSTTHIEMPSSIIFEYTRNKIISKINDTSCNPIEKKMLETLNFSTIPLISVKENGMGFFSFIDILIYGIKSITEKEITFDVCTHFDPCSKLIYNRIRKQFVCIAKDCRGYSTRLQYEFMDHHKDCNDKLLEAIRYIEQMS